MATASLSLLNDYPTTDGKPMAETDWHAKVMIDSRQTLDRYYADEPLVYVTGNMLLFYEPGNKRRHISPDVFVVKGVPKHDRPNFLTWLEGKTPDWALEVTSSSTRHRDLNRKMLLYQDVLKIQEYFLFDPLGDYLDPQLQGHRLVRGKYSPIREVHGRLPSKVLGLHLEADGDHLRYFDPAVGAWLLTHQEQVERLQEENDRLRHELAELRRRNGKRH